MNFQAVGGVAAASLMAFGTVEATALPAATTPPYDHFILAGNGAGPGNARTMEPSRAVSRPKTLPNDWQDKAEIIGILLDVYRLQPGGEDDKEVITRALAQERDPQNRWQQRWQQRQRTLLWTWAEYFLGNDSVNDYVSARLALSESLKQRPVGFLDGQEDLIGGELRDGRGELTRLAAFVDGCLLERAVMVNPPFSIVAVFKAAAQKYVEALRS